jgi:hypothetical protein
LGRAAEEPVTAEAGKFNFGNARESENAPEADRCFPTFGLFIAPIVSHGP